MTKMENPNLSEKMDNYDYEKNIFVIMMSNNMPKTMTRQQRY